MQIIKKQYSSFSNFNMIDNDVVYECCVEDAERDVLPWVVYSVVCDNGTKSYLLKIDTDENDKLYFFTHDKDSKYRSDDDYVDNTRFVQREDAQKVIDALMMQASQYLAI